MFMPTQLKPTDSGYNILNYSLLLQFSLNTASALGFLLCGAGLLKTSIDNAIKNSSYHDYKNFLYLGNLAACAAYLAIGSILCRTIMYFSWVKYTSSTLTDTASDNTVRAPILSAAALSIIGKRERGTGILSTDSVPLGTLIAEHCDGDSDTDPSHSENSVTLASSLHRSESAHDSNGSGDTGDSDTDENHSGKRTAHSVRSHRS